MDRLRFSVEKRLLAVIFLAIALLGAVSIFYVNRQTRVYARQDAEEKAKIILDRNLAVHTYYSHQLKPALFEQTSRFFDPGYFEPKWMSSTYAVREIDKYYKVLFKKDHYYKEAAIDARSPENEADAFEREFIMGLNRPAGVTDYSEIKYIEGDPFLVVIKKGETMEEGCLRCHSTPDAAPANLVAHYGDKRSFNRHSGDVVSAISIRIPLKSAYANATRLIFKLSVFFVSALVVVLAIFVYLCRQWIFTPLGEVRQQADRIAQSPEHLGSRIREPGGAEFFKLVHSFNTMSERLLAGKNRLESRVAARTEALTLANAQLSKEIREHRETIDKLKVSMAEVKTLKGILPICSHCKNVRDDQGYWKQVETYIIDHSEADISGSICPSCAKKHYPDYDLYDA